MSLNQKVVLLVVLIGAVAAIAFYETRSETTKTNDSTSVATSSSNEQTTEGDGLDLTRDEQESSSDAAESDQDGNMTEVSEDESTASTDSSPSGSTSEPSSDVTFSGEFATTEHATNQSEDGEMDGLTLSTGDETSSQEGNTEGDQKTSRSSNNSSGGNSVEAVTGEDLPSANSDPSTTSSGSSTDSTTEDTGSDGYDTYEVQRGDNLWKIASKQYGSGSQWKRIKKANSEKIGDSNDLKQGQVLRIPTKESSGSTTANAAGGTSSQDIVVQQEATGSQDLTNGSTGSGETTPDSSNETEGDSTGSYTVQEGDRLWNIVQQQYGSATYDLVQKVADHNDINPRALRPGMELDLPADLSSSESATSTGSSAASTTRNTSDSAGNPPFEPDAGQKWYRVKRGESLWKISKKEFGAGKYFTRIWELNKDRLEDYNSLSSGTWVLLPERP